jgi:hypothetical protein
MVGQKKLMIFFSLFVLSIFFSNNPVSAQTEYQFTSINGDEIKTSSVAKQILERIELSKKLLADLQAGKNLKQTEKQKFIEEQRKISQQKLQIQLDRMNKDYEPFTPRNAYAGFLTGVNATHHGIYWDQFNYMYEKTKLAKAAKQTVLDNGGTYIEAFQEYVKYASMTRGEMIKLNQELNIKHGFADTEIQKDFDKFGKLPRI